MSRKEETPAEVVLPVTPMLDMTFQLMFFFLTTFNPSSAREGQMGLTLPSENARQASRPNEADPLAVADREQFDDRAVVTISLRGQKDPLNRGLISYLTINTGNVPDEEITGTAEERVRILGEILGKVKPAEAAGRPAPAVRMAAEGGVQWSQVMKIMDVCYRTGYQVSFIKPPAAAQ